MEGGKGGSRGDDIRALGIRIRIKNLPKIDVDCSDPVKIAIGRNRTEGRVEI
jgi:hypothetical protein